MGLQVIGAGFGRTGTNSFQIALEMLGFAPCHHMNVLMSRPTSLRAWERAADGTLTDWDEIYGEFLATCDFPHCAFYAELAEFYPDAKVVLTVRDPEEWYASAISTIFSPANQARHEGRDPDHPTSISPELLRAIRRSVGRVLDLRTVNDKHAAIEAFERHNAQVKATIPADRLLVYEVGDGWDPLCEFLGVAVPSEPYPHTNTTREFQSRLDRTT